MIDTFTANHTIYPDSSTGAGAFKSKLQTYSGSQYMIQITITSWTSASSSYGSPYITAPIRIWNNGGLQKGNTIYNYLTGAAYGNIWYTNASDANHRFLVGGDIRLDSSSWTVEIMGIMVDGSPTVTCTIYLSNPELTINVFKLW